MRQRKTVLMWVLAVALLAALPVTQALADPPTLPADKLKTSPGNIPPVPRAMPDLTPYWNFDPPKHPLFDISKLTISGDMRVRPELRSNGTFGVSTSGTGRLAQGPGNNNANDQFVTQWMRLGIDYAISPDVDVFIQEQYAKVWGATSQTCSGGVCSNDAFNQNNANSLFTRQAWIMIRNLGIDGLSLKAGRQLVVMGNHRLFGHFDWANTGFSHDGITFQYNQPMYEVWGGWIRVADLDPGVNNPGAGVIAPGNTTANASSDTDMTFLRLAFKPMKGLAIEPLWVFFNNKQASIGGTGFAGNSVQAHAPDQNRHTLGGRVAFKQGIFDATAEYYWQTGSMGLAQSNNRLHINANAFAAVAGVTLKDAPMQPRFGLEFNYASGDGDAANCNSNNGQGCGGNANTFENLYPTNHIVMGYADLMAWRNMVGYSGDIQLKPTANSHFETKFWLFRKANNHDCWYKAAQSCYFTQTGANGGVATSNSLAKELDMIYTLFFKDNKVAWQIGGSYIWAGEMINQIAASNASGNGPSGTNQIWAYTQLHVNF
ncbi:alginate export family protein [Petrachloros mirabilis]